MLTYDTSLSKNIVTTDYIIIVQFIYAQIHVINEGNGIVMTVLKESIIH